VTFKEIPICTNTAQQDYPAIYGNRIVRTDDRDGNPDVYMYDLSTSKESPICTDFDSAKAMNWTTFLNLKADKNPYV
jgi:beta propeller repeat protein